MARIREKQAPKPVGMPLRLQRFAASEWALETGARIRPYRAMCDYYAARAEWFERNLGVVREESWRLARQDSNSGLIGYWAALGSGCRAAVLKSEAGQGPIESFCTHRSCPCDAAGQVVAVDRSGVR